MSLWKFGDFEADVDFTDADFLDAIDEAKAAMHEAEQNVPVVGKNSIKLCNEAAESLLDFETAEAKKLDDKYDKYVPNQNITQQFPNPQPQSSGNRQQRRNYQKQYGKGKYSNTGR